MQALDVIKGDVTFNDYLADLLVEGSESQVVSFTHNGKKKKGIVIGTKGDNLIVARGSERHTVKNGQSQRTMEAEETMDDPLEELAAEYLSLAQLDSLAEALADGEVDLGSNQLLELSGRQLRFLFATGAFKAGKAAAKAVTAVTGPGKAVQTWRPVGLSGGHKLGRPAARAAAKQAMQQQLKSYKAAKATGIAGAKYQAGWTGAKPGKGSLGVIRAVARGLSRASAG